MFRQFTRLFFSPDTIGGNGSAAGSELGKEDIFDILNTDDVPEAIALEPEKTTKETGKETKSDEDESETPEGKDSEEKSDGDEEEDELKALEEELNEIEPDDEKLDLVTPVPRREILKKYPNVFKDFPYLEKAYYREQQFTEVHASIEDARISKDKAETLDAFDADLRDGNIEKMLLAVKSDEKAFAKVADTYLETLAKVDQTAYHTVLGNVIKHTIMEMVGEARAQNNDTLQNAAAILNQFVFGSSKFVPPTTLSKPESNKPDSRTAQLDAREKQINDQLYNRANNEITGRINNAFKATIEQNIDPKQSMTDYVRRNAIRDANETLTDLMSKDTRFKSIVSKLWEYAKKAEYSKESLDKIRSAHVSKAKTLLPSVIKKARNDALRGMGKRVAEDKDNDNNENRVEKPQRHNERPRSTNTNSGKSKIPDGMSTVDFFMQD